MRVGVTFSAISKDPVSGYKALVKYEMNGWMLWTNAYLNNWLYEWMSVEINDWLINELKWKYDLNLISNR